jgi:ribosomal protein L11 methyltransferase
MTFYEIEFPLADLDLVRVEETLLDIGASSITLIDRGDEPVLEPLPGEVRLWSDTQVRALFQGDSENDSAAALKQLDRLAAVFGPHITQTARVRAVVNQDWERVWLKDWKSMRFGRRLWVCPTAAALPQDPRAIVVRLDPGLAFGTGTHPTTALCLQILESLPVSGRTVLDYGCGSGILGIAALKLGAAHVLAVDLDLQAVLATRENAIRNGVCANIEVHKVDAKGVGDPAIAGGLKPAFCVMANILAGPLIELAPTLTAACIPGGFLLLSGLLKIQAHQVKAAYASGFDMVQVVERGDWCCIYARRGD